MSEAQIGSEFNDLGLKDLFGHVKSLKLDLEEASGKNEREGGGGTYAPPPKDPDDENNGPPAIVTCPKCSSRWKMADGEVVYNAIAASANGEDSDDGE